MCLRVRIQWFLHVDYCLGTVGASLRDGDESIRQPRILISCRLPNASYMGVSAHFLHGIYGGAASLNDELSGVALRMRGASDSVLNY